MPNDERKTGTVARLFRDKAYGFVACPADARDYFFHATHLENCTLAQIEEGATLTFTVGQNRDGKPQAEEVRLVEQAEIEGKRAQGPRPKTAADHRREWGR